MTSTGRDNLLHLLLLAGNTATINKIKDSLGWRHDKPFYFKGKLRKLSALSTFLEAAAQSGDLLASDLWARREYKPSAFSMRIGLAASFGYRNSSMDYPCQLNEAYLVPAWYVCLRSGDAIARTHHVELFRGLRHSWQSKRTA